MTGAANKRARQAEALEVCAPRGVTTYAPPTGPSRDLAERAGEEVYATDLMTLAQRADIKATTPSLYVHAALQAGVDYLGGLPTGGKLILPPRKLLTAAPVRFASKVAIEGAGPATHLYNDRSSGSDTGSLAFLMGDLYGSALTSGTATANKFPVYVLNATTVPTNAFTFTTAGDAAAFAVDELVFVATSTFQTLGGNSLHDYLQLNKIKSVDSNTGAVVFKYPIHEALASPVIYKISATDTAYNLPYFAVEKCRLANMTIEAFTWAQRWAMLDCLVEDLWLKDCNTGVVGNAAVRTTIRNVVGTWGYKAIEIKMGANFCTVENCKLAYKPVQGVTPDILVATGEQSYGTRIRDCEVTAGDDYTVGALLLQLGGMNERVSRCNLVARSRAASSAGQIISTAANSGWNPRDLSVEDCTLDGGPNMSNHWRIGNQTASSHPVRFTLSKTRHFGAVSSQTLWANTGSGHVDTNNFFENGSVTGKQVDTGVDLTSDGVTQVNLADDGFYSCRPPVGHSSTGQGTVQVTCGYAATRVARYVFRAASTNAPILLDAAATDMVGVGSALTAGSSDGTDTKFNVGQTAGVLYFKNRLGASALVGIAWG